MQTFTYEAMFNNSETVYVWYYFSDWVLLANKKHMEMVIENGFSKNRVSCVGSTLSDYYISGRASGAETPSDAVKIMLLVKAVRRSGLSNDLIIDKILDVLEHSGARYSLYIKPHPTDKDKYARYISGRRDKVFLIDRNQPLHKYLSGMDMLVTCGLTGAIMECLPSGKPIITVDLSPNLDKKIFMRDDLRKIVPFFQDLEDFVENAEQHDDTTVLTVKV